MTDARALMQFQSYPMNNFYFMVNDGLRTAIANNDYRKLAGIVGATQLAFLAEGLTRQALKQLPLSGGGSGDDDKKTLAELLAGNQIKNIFSQIPLVGSFINSAKYGSFPSPVVETTRRAVGGLTSALNAKQPEARARGAVKAVGAAATLAGIPGASQASQSIVGEIKSDSDEVHDMINESVNKLSRSDDRSISLEARRIYLKAKSAGLLKRDTTAGEFASRYKKAYKSMQKRIDQ